MLNRLMQVQKKSFSIFKGPFPPLENPLPVYSEAAPLPPISPKRKLFPYLLMLSFILGIILQPVFFNACCMAAYVEIKEMAFSYMPEIEPYLILEAKKTGSKNKDYMDKNQNPESFNKQYMAFKGQEMNLEKWSADSGQAPGIFKLRVNFRNYSPEASDEIPLLITLYTKTGESLVHPKTFLIDQAHMNKTATWILFQTIEGTVPVLAGKQTFDYFSEPIKFGEYLATLKNRFPVAIKAEVKIGNLKTVKTLEIPVSSGYFATEKPY